MAPEIEREILRYAAFTANGRGGNPAGVVLDARGLADADMLAIAADLGYSETAFLSGNDIRYFSPLAEVPFCGHATIATAVALAERDGPGDVVLATASGPVPVRTQRDQHGRILATLAHELHRREARYGLETMCIGGGQGLAAVFERVV